MVSGNKEYNFYPLVVHCVVTEEKVSFADIQKFVENTIGKKVDPNSVFIALSKLVEYRILKMNLDTTGTFSLGDWKSPEE
jgi:DNA-binding PadR family transcriptional regulator